MHSVASEVDPIRWYLAYFHEAGHAVAARSRNRPVNEIYIHPEKGYTRHGDDTVEYDGDSHQFIVWAGPWAELRACWVLQGRDKISTEDHSLFVDEVRSLLRKNSSDWLEYHRAMGRMDLTEVDALDALVAYNNSEAVSSDDCEPDEQWDRLLDDMWLDINNLATSLIADTPNIHLDNAQLDLFPVTKLWRKWGWEPPEEKIDNPA